MNKNEIKNGKKKKKNYTYFWCIKRAKSKQKKKKNKKITEIAGMIVIYKQSLS